MAREATTVSEALLRLGAAKNGAKFASGRVLPPSLRSRKRAGSRDEERAFSLYGDILGWTAVERQDLGEGGRHLTFAGAGGAQPVGSTCDVARRPHVHAQWLYFFAVSDLDSALTRVRDLGGLVLQPTATPDGHRVVACDDAQGAAFGLYEAATPRS